MKIKVLAATLMFAFVSSGQAIVLTNFQFDGGSLSPTTETFGGSTSAITLGSNITVDSVNGTLLASPSTTYTSTANRVSFDYTVTGLSAGETLTLDSASIDYTGFGGSVRVDFVVGSTFNASTDPTDGSDTFTRALSASGLTNGQTVTVNFGIRDNNSDVYTLDNLTLNGTVVVPEPSSFALLITGSLALFTLRRRRR